MKIACLGWGSLIWRPDGLPLRDKPPRWHKDGPKMPIEFARCSKDGRITLVILPIKETTRRVPVLWAYLDCATVDQAREALKKREGTRESCIGIWTSSEPGSFEYADVIGRWAATKLLDCVVWTALGPKFDGRKRAPTCSDVITYLADGLSVPLAAELYVRQTPPQIRTPYRSQIEQRLGWTYDGSKTDGEIIEP